jgi:hypothetical protein
MFSQSSKDRDVCLRFAARETKILNSNSLQFFVNMESPAGGETKTWLANLILSFARNDSQFLSMDVFGMDVRAAGESPVPMQPIGNRNFSEINSETEEFPTCFGKAAGEFCVSGNTN